MDVPGLSLATNLIPRGLTQRYSVSQANFVEHADESMSKNHDQCVITRSLSPCPSLFPTQVLAVDQMWYLAMFSSYGRQNAPRYATNHWLSRLFLYPRNPLHSTVRRSTICGTALSFSRNMEMPSGRNREGSARPHSLSKSGGFGSATKPRRSSAIPWIPVVTHFVDKRGPHVYPQLN